MKLRSPWENLDRRQRWATSSLLIVLVVSRFLAASPSMSTEPHPVPTDWRTLGGDSVTYDMPAYNLVAGNGYSGSLAPPYKPAVLRTPGYPLVLASVYATLGRSTTAVVAVQLLFDFAVALILFNVALRLLPSWWAIGFLGAVVVLAPWSVFVDRVASEPLTTLLLVTSLLLCVSLPRPGRWLVLGLCLGALLLCRSAFALLPAAVLVWAVAVDRGPLGSPGGLAVAALLVGVVGIWGPWIVRNAMTFDRFIPLGAGGAGLSLWVGTWYAGGPHWNTKRTPEGTYVRTLPDHSFWSESERERVVPAFERYIESYFSSGGIEIAEPDRVFREVAFEKIRARPIDWLVLRLLHTAEMLQQRYFADRLIDSRGSPAYMRNTRFRRGRLIRNEAAWTTWTSSLAALGWVVGLLALAGVVISIRRPAWQPLTLFFLYTWLIHFPTHGEARYLAPAYGAAMLLAALALREGSAAIIQAKESF